MPRALPPTSVTLTTANTSHLVAGANPTRTTIAITNTSDTAIVFLGIGYPAVLGSGFVLPPFSSYQMDMLDNTSQAINAISSTANVTLAVQEMGG